MYTDQIDPTIAADVPTEVLFQSLDDSTLSVVDWEWVSRVVGPAESRRMCLQQREWKLDRSWSKIGARLPAVYRGQNDGPGRDR